MSGLRRALWILAPILLLLVFVSQTAELRTLARLFAGADLGWLVAALLLQVVFAINQGAFYEAVFQLLDTAVPLRTSIWLSMVMAFASLASPAGTATGVAYFVAAARGVGVPAARAFWASLVYYLFDYSAGLAALLAGLLILLSKRDLRLSQLIIAGLFFVLVVGAAALVIRLVVAPATVPNLLARVGGVIDRVGVWVRRRPFLGQERIAEWSRDLQEVIATVRQNPRRAIRPWLHALAVEILGLATLAAVFQAIGYSLHPGVLIAGYAVGLFFMVVSITPSGVGVTEGAMIVTFTSLDVPLETAVAGALLFRLFTFWLPLVAGFIALHTFPAPTAGPRENG